MLEDQRAKGKHERKKGRRKSKKQREDTRKGWKTATFEKKHEAEINMTCDRNKKDNHVRHQKVKWLTDQRHEAYSLVNG